MSTTVETFEFQTEARQLLDLMVHSIYTHKEIFLRELISNSSDAMDRRKFEAIKNPELLDDDKELRVFIEPNVAERTLTVHDDGIGMSREEVIEGIGTIAKSGTQEFMRKLKESKEAETPELIGQFGIGFYSTFMVAERVTLVTRRAGSDTATKWESSGEGSYTLEDGERDSPGTSITLHLKETDEEDGISDYTAEWTIKGIVKKYSDFVSYPIQMNIERTQIERDDEGKPVEGAQETTTIEVETLNSMKAIWLKEKADVTEEELNEFYKHISHDWTAPLEVIRAKMEGTLEYRMLLFIPSKAPMDLFYMDAHRGLQLYVRRVFILDDCKELLPEYLRFVRGVVDSEDVSLNVSREILQQDRQIERIRKGLVSKILDSLKAMQKDEEKYLIFWGEFGRVLKEGIYGDVEHRDDILALLLCASTDDEKKVTSLKAYIDRMKPEQDAIYYMAGESRAGVENSPHLEAFLDRGYEVLLLTDPVDEVWLQSVREYEDKKLQSITKGVPDLGSEEEKEKGKEEESEQKEKYGDLLDKLKTVLDAEVKEVRLSKRLTTSAACLVGDDGDISPQLEKLMSTMNQGMGKTKRILELNPSHPILQKLQGLIENDDDTGQIDDYAHLLYGQAILAEGGQLSEPGKFAKLVADLMVTAL